MMFAGLEQRVRQKVAERCRLLVAGLVETAEAEIGDARVEQDGERLVIRGRGLVRRWLNDGSLRFLGRIGR